MSSLATAGKGVVLKRAGTAIVELKSIGGPNMKADMIDVTSLDSAGWREVIAGLKDGGEWSLEGNFAPAAATQVALMQDFNDGTSAAYVLVCTDTASTEISCTAFVSSIAVSASTDAALSVSFTLKVSGAVTIEGVTP